MCDTMSERYELATERLGQIAAQAEVKERYRAYFETEAAFLGMLKDLMEVCEAEDFLQIPAEELENWNHRLYADVMPDAYETSFLNPAYTVSLFGEEAGRLFAMVAAELRRGIAACFEQRKDKLTIYMELFLEIYSVAADDMDLRQIQQAVYWFKSDYADVFAADAVRERLGMAKLPYEDIIQEAAGDLRYLYRYGRYISPSTRELAAYLFSLPQEEIDHIAKTIVEGYHTGYVVGRRDIHKKNAAPLLYYAGMERILQAMMPLLADLGIRPVVRETFIDSQPANRQYGYDHRFDDGIYLDRQYKERYLQVYRTEFENCKEAAAKMGGPICLEAFGEAPFSPASKPENLKYTEKQQAISIELNSELRRITNQYIPQEESSFTIMALPTPEIGAQFTEIFDACMQVNTLDVNVYRQIQQTMIDVLDQGTHVVIKGKGSNETDLQVALHPLDDPSAQTNFENCLADVNIPVGEVFTSPQLKGTNGLLHVSRVFLRDLEYVDLRIRFADGMITEYSCGNFADPEEGKAYIKENLLDNRDTLPMGEFAIGTNTTAYAMGMRYDIFRQLPILIAEKTGPHFAIGDTCYSYAEDVPVYNQDGKEIIARDNECSILRNTEPEKAYFSCHTDITIPYFELGEISAVQASGEKTAIILDSRFVLPGTEALNEALDGLAQQ